MDKAAQAAIASTVDAYSVFFVEDFATSVLGTLRGTYPVNDDNLKTFIANTVRDKFEALGPVHVTAVNAITRFLDECATFAVEQNFPAAMERSAWDEIKDRPSIHHDDISKLIFASATLYQKTVEETICNVIGTDARNAVNTITTGAANRTSQINTGGRLHLFNWGILSDGLWLNGALVRAFELATIFRPGEQVNLQYTRTAFEYARIHASGAYIGREEEGVARGHVDMLLASGNNTVLNVAMSHASQDLVHNLLFYPGALPNQIDRWELGVRSPTAMIEDITELSSLAVILQHLIDASGTLAEELASVEITARLRAVYNAVTLCLVGFEALRETIYEESLILAVTSDNEDPTVDAFVNTDMFERFKSEDGLENELMLVATYLDPRKEVPPPVGGWSLSWYLNRKDDIISEVVGANDDRLERLRGNDAAVIQALVQNVLTTVATSYSSAADRGDISNSVTMRINEIARRVTSDNSDGVFSLEEEIVKLLTMVIGDPFVTSSAQQFMDVLRTTEDDARADAKALTIAAVAIVDAISFLTEQSPVTSVA